MHFRQTTLAVSLALASLPALSQTAAPAAPASDWTVTGNAGLFSDYTFRGISQTARKPAFQGGFDVAHASGFYVGNWNSNVDSAFFNGANIEMDFYGGFKTTAGGVGLDFGVLYYYYPGSGAGGTNEIDNTELYVGASFGPVSLKYSHSISDFFGFPDSKGAYYLDASGSFPLTKELSLIGHVGYQGNLKNGARISEFDGALHDSITDWKIGVTYDASGWLLGAAYVDTNRSFTGGTAATRNKDIAKGTVVVSVSKTF